MSPYLRSLVVSPDLLARHGITLPPRHAKVSLGRTGCPNVTEAVSEYAEYFKDGRRPPNGTLKEIALRYGIPASTISARLGRMSYK